MRSAVKPLDPGRSKLFERTAREAKLYAVWTKVLRRLLGLLVLIIILVFIATILYSRYGSMAFTVTKFDSANYSIYLSETPDFTRPIVRLNAKMAENVTNISVNDLPADVDMINGEHNGANYLAYTFYVINRGKYTLDFEYFITISNVKNDLDKAIRYRVYVNGEYTDYARTRSDGTGPEYGTTEFLTATTVCRRQVSDFKPGEATKFTIVVWLEGDDPDCTNELMGGRINSVFTAAVIAASIDENAD